MSWNLEASYEVYTNLEGLQATVGGYEIISSENERADAVIASRGGHSAYACLRAKLCQNLPRQQVRFSLAETAGKRSWAEGP